MSEPLADEFARLLAERGGFTWHADMFQFAWCNRDRIIAALRGNEEDARIARIVREPTDKHCRDLYDEVTDSMEHNTDEDNGRAGFEWIVHLANEAGERERRG